MVLDGTPLMSPNCWRAIQEAADARDLADTSSGVRATAPLRCSALRSRTVSPGGRSMQWRATSGLPTR